MQEMLSIPSLNIGFTFAQSDLKSFYDDYVKLQEPLKVNIIAEQRLTDQTNIFGYLEDIQFDSDHFEIMSILTSQGLNLERMSTINPKTMLVRNKKSYPIILDSKIAFGSTQIQHKKVTTWLKDEGREVKTIEKFKARPL